MLICNSKILYLESNAYFTTMNHILTFITNKRCKNLKNLVFSLINCIFCYDCDGYKIPYANTYQKNKYTDKFLQVSIEVLLVLM